MGRLETQTRWFCVIQGQYLSKHTSFDSLELLPYEFLVSELPRHNLWVFFLFSPRPTLDYDLMLQIAFPLAGKQVTPPAVALVSSGACNATVCTQGLTGPSNSQPASQQMHIYQFSTAAVTLPPAPYTLLPGYVSRPQVHMSFQAS